MVRACEKTGVSGTAELSVTYRRDKSVDIRDTQIHTFRPVESFVYLQSCFTRQLPISYSSDGEAAQAFTHARAGGVCVGRGCRLRLLELSLRRWRARVRALAMLRLELLPVRHGGKEGLTRLHRRRSSLQGLRRCRRGLRGEDGVGSFRSRTLGGVLERRDMIDQELEVDVDAV